MTDELLVIVAALVALLLALVVGLSPAPERPWHAGNTTEPVIYVGAH